MSEARFDAWFQSDAGLGRDTPETLGAIAAAAGLAGFALADAGTTAGVEGARASAASAGVGFLAAVAVEAAFGGEAVTVLGFGFAPGPGALEDLLAATRAVEARREATVRERLGAAGLRLPEGVAPDAAGLVAAGHAVSRHAARRRFLGPGGLAHVREEPPQAKRVVEAVTASGGRVAFRPGAVLASDAKAFEFAASQLKAAGASAVLFGCDTERAAWGPVASRLGLAAAGGSGYRGAGRGPDPGEGGSGSAAWAALGG